MTDASKLRSAVAREVRAVAESYSDQPVLDGEVEADVERVLRAVVETLGVDRGHLVAVNGSACIAKIKGHDATAVKLYELDAALSALLDSVEPATDG